MSIDGLVPPEFTGANPASFSGHSMNANILQFMHNMLNDVSDPKKIQQDIKWLIDVPFHNMPQSSSSTMSYLLTLSHSFSPLKASDINQLISVAQEDLGDNPANISEHDIANAALS